MKQVARRGLIRATLGQRNYGIYAAGNGISLIGNWMQRTATGWLAWQLTEQSFWVGIVVMADLLPALLVAPFGGVLADRADRRRIMLITQSTLSVLAIVLFLMGASGALGLTALIGLVATQGIIVGFNQPARLALIPSLVEPPFLATAIAVNSIVFNGARFVGPAIAGVIIATQGVPAVFLANAVTYIAFLISLFMIRVESEPPSRSRGAVFLEIAEGVRFTMGHAALGPLFIMFIASALFVRPIGELLPGLADEVFGGGAETLALLSSTMGLGAMIGGFGLAQWGGADRATLALASIAGSALSAMLLAVAPTLPLALVAIAVFGGILIAAGVAAQTLMQMAAPPQLRGRVMSLFGLVFRGGPAIGAVLTGSLADRFGLRPALFAAAAIMLLLWVPIWRRRAAIAAALE